MRQEDVARGMAGLGLGWTASRVTQVVTGRGTLSLAEVAGLCATLQRPLTKLLGEAREVDLRAGTAQVTHIVEALQTGSSPAWQERRTQEFTAALSGWGEFAEATVKMARRLGVTPGAVEVAAVELWNRSLPDERDRRVKPQEGESARALQARRGHVSRALVTELTDYFKDYPVPTVNDGPEENR